VPEELFSSDKHIFVLQGIEHSCLQRRPTTRDLSFSFLQQNGYYLSGNGGFGGGLESRRIDSELCELRTKLLLAAVCSKICRSLGVRGISGREFLCVNSDPYPEVL